ncbi:glycosyltransferase [Pseudonocardiaceae bacterium YIM PH 21723]|nr:glycosyltransferase [Pseudonocardiaceae bacterium YIM PH 21723]
MSKQDNRGDVVKTRISFVALGSRGDVEPYIALGRDMRDRGFQVRVIAPKVYAHLVEGAGLDCVPLSTEPRKVLASAQGQSTLSTGRDGFPYAQGMAALFESMVDELIPEISAGLRDTDAVMHGMLGLFFHHMVAPDLPYCFGGLQPVTPTGEFRNIWGFGGAGIDNRTTHIMGHQVRWQTMRQVLMRYWQRTPEVPRPPLYPPIVELERAGFPQLYGFSPSVVPAAADWGPNVQVTGTWFADRAGGWTPPVDLASFVDSGPAPVYVGFGSMVPADRDRTDAMVRGALRRAGVRGVLLGDPARNPGDDQVHVVDSVPHSWLLPRMSAAVHHGGAGTLAASLRAGLPTVVTPFFSDQPFWAERVQALGVGPTAPRFHELTEESLATAISAVVTDAGMRERAAELGERIRAEDGVRTAGDHLEDWLRLGAPRNWRG